MAAIDRIDTDLTAGRAGRIEAVGGARAIIIHGGVFAARMALSCCFALLFVVGVGASGFAVGAGAAYIASFAVLAPYQPYFAPATITFLAIGFMMAYRRPQPVGTPRSDGTAPVWTRIARMGLWAAAVLVAVAIAVPYLVPLMVAPLVFDL